MDIKECFIKFKPEGIEVTYTGNWIRSDLDRVQVALIRELPRHVAERKKLIEKGEEEWKATRRKK